MLLFKIVMGQFDQNSFANETQCWHERVHVQRIPTKRSAIATFFLHEYAKER